MSPFSPQAGKVLAPLLGLSQWFAEQVQPHESDLRAYLRGRFPGLEDVDDLVQETYMRILRARKAGRVAVARPYLFATARNAALDHFRTRGNVRFEPLDDSDSTTRVEEAPDAAEATARNQEVTVLHEAIAALPPRCRQVLVMRRFEGRSHAEIARALGIAEKTVDAQLCIALFRCRQFFLSRGVSRDVLTQAGRAAASVA